MQLAARRALVATAAALALTTGAATAAAQSPAELATARSRFDEGLSLAAAGDWTNALAAFQEVGRVKLTPQVRFHIARCEENLGWWVRALGKYRLVVVEARGIDGADEAAQRAGEAVARLERTVPVLAVSVRGAEGRVELFLDDAPLGPASGTRAVPVDPGTHRIEARQGATSVTQTVRAEASQRQRVELRFTASSPAAPKVLDPPGTSPSPGAPAVGAGAAIPAATGDGGTSTSALAPWLLVGVGGAGLVTGAVGLAVRQDAVADHDGQCLDRRCPAELEDAGSRGRVANAVMWTGFAVGAAALTSGVLWLVLRDAPSDGVDAGAGAVRLDARRLRISF